MKGLKGKSKEILGPLGLRARRHQRGSLWESMAAPGLLVKESGRKIQNLIYL